MTLDQLKLLTANQLWSRLCELNKGRTWGLYDHEGLFLHAQDSLSGHIGLLNHLVGVRFNVYYEMDSTSQSWSISVVSDAETANVSWWLRERLICNFGRFVSLLGGSFTQTASNPKFNVAIWRIPLRTFSVQLVVYLAVYCVTFRNPEFLTGLSWVKPSQHSEPKRRRRRK